MLIQSDATSDDLTLMSCAGRQIINYPRLAAELKISIALLAFLPPARKKPRSSEDLDPMVSGIDNEDPATHIIHGEVAWAPQETSATILL